MSDLEKAIAAESAHRASADSVIATRVSDLEAKLGKNDVIHPAPVEFTQTELEQDAILRYFHYSHLPEKLAVVSKPFCEVAANMVRTLPRNAERSAGLRKLLEAKDCAVRANV